MPKRPRRLCPPRRRQIHVADPRQSASKRGYDRTWRRVRLHHLQTNPLCVLCAAAGRTTPAEQVDHIQPIAAGGARLDHANLRSLCETHHAQVTAHYRLTGRNELPT